MNLNTSLLVVVVFLVVVSVGSAIAAFALRKKGEGEGVKLPKIGGEKPWQWFKNITGNLGWLFAIGGQAFCLILIWQCFPEFFGHWLETNGFWFIQLGFVVSVILLKYAKPQVAGWIALLLTLICLVVSMVSAGKRVSPVNTRTVAISIPKSVIERKWEYEYRKPPWVTGLNPNIRGETKPAKIVYFDEMRFDFKTILLNGTESPYHGTAVKSGSKLVWEGAWSQVNPSNSGQWYLEPVQFDRGIPTRFKGSKTTKTGESYDIQLRAID